MQSQALYPPAIKHIEIRLASEADAAGIHQLMTANLAANGGMLSASFSLEQIASIVQSMPVIVARRDAEIVGFLMTGSRAASNAVPILRTMLDAYPGTDDAYVYGPVCVASALRGQGLAQAMFAELRRQLPGREGILFVRRDNAASLRAHGKMAMHEVAEFTFRDAAHVVLAYIG